MPVHEQAEEGLDVGIVAGAQGQERELLVPRGGEHPVRHLHENVRIALPDGPPDHAGLAEPASPGAAPGDLQDQPVVDGLHQGNDGAGGSVPGVQVRDGPLADDLPVRVETGAEDSLDLRQARETRGPALAPRLRGHQGPGDLADHVLSLADHEGVDEGRHGQGVEGAGAAGDDEGMVLPARGGAEGDAAQVQHGEDVRVGQLVLEGEADEVEVAERRARLQRGERQAAADELGLEVRPGGVAPLRDDAGLRVEDAVEDLNAEVGHADLVDVRKGQRDAQAAGRAVLDDGVDFAAQVAAGLFDPGEEGLFSHWSRFR